MRFARPSGRLEKREVTLVCRGTLGYPIALHTHTANLPEAPSKDTNIRGGMTAWPGQGRIVMTVFLRDPKSCPELVPGRLPITCV